jgi:hypothetical protein
MKWVDSMLSDGVNGTVSSKRVITLIAFVLCGIAFMVDLLTDYEAKPQLFDSMMYIVIAGLGFTASEKFAKGNEK